MIVNDCVVLCTDSRWLDIVCSKIKAIRQAETTGLYDIQAHKAVRLHIHMHDYIVSVEFRAEFLSFNY